MRNIISFNSKQIEKIINISSKNIKNTSLLTAISNEDIVNEITTKNEGISLLKDINLKNEIFIIDFMQELKRFVNVKEGYILEAMYNNLASDSPLNKKKKVIEEMSLSNEFYREVFRVFFNKVIDGTHTNKIILLKLFFDSDYKVENDAQVMLNEREKEAVIKANEYLMKLYDLYDEIVKGGESIECKEKLNLTIIKDTEFYISKKLADEINVRLLEKIENINIFKGEKIYTSYNNIKYYFQKAVLSNKNKLIIVFSAFSNDKAKYNYINSLRFIDCNKLFILDDYGSKGTYYLGKNGNLNIETSVMALISNIMAQNSIEFKNVISAGSSKGGTSAMYYGLKYNFGTIIVGAPQYKIGSYLLDLTIKDYAEEIFGSLDEKNRIKYNNIIRLSINKCAKSKIFLLTGEGDPQYKRVLKDFENVAKEFQLDLTINKCDIQSHGEIANKFPEYLEEKLQLVLQEGYIKSKSLNKIRKKLRVNIKNIKNK